MGKSGDKKYRRRRKLLKMLGISGAAFIFQAGYGAPQPDLLTGRVLEGLSGEPLAGIRVTVRPDVPDGKKLTVSVVTDSNGSFRYNRLGEESGMVFIIDLEDSDGGESGGLYQSKRLVHHLRDGRYIEIPLDVVSAPRSRSVDDAATAADDKVTVSAPLDAVSAPQDEK